LEVYVKTELQEAGGKVNGSVEAQEEPMRSERSEEGGTAPSMPELQEAWAEQMHVETAVINDSSLIAVVLPW
jgi:hypothetical protein